MRIAIVGYGKMGRTVRRIIEDGSAHTVSAIIDPFCHDSAVTSAGISSTSLAGSEVIIDFSAPEAVPENLLLYSELGIPAVIGTTGWLGELAELTKKMNMEKTRIIWSGNFSVGVAIFLQLVERAGRLIDTSEEYDVSVAEIHHREKKDAPSGTAMMAAEKLLKTIGRKSGILPGNPVGRIGKEMINVSSLRTGFIPGVHTVLIDGPSDTIEIRHTARNRDGFASGAVKAAEWIVSQKPGIYTMDDFISDLTGGCNA